jgi:hypothetical protein
MNRRQFIKSAGVAAALPAIAITCKYEDDEKGPEKESCNGHRWDYRVYCFEREQGEWVFSENIRGSFAPEREYMTFEEEKYMPYAGWMDQGKLHFTSLEEAQDFVDMHVRVKDDTNLIDSIYDIYYVDWDDPRLIDKPELNPTEIQVAHYWFNGHTGRQINWQSKKPYTNWNRVECA